MLWVINLIQIQLGHQSIIEKNYFFLTVVISYSNKMESYDGDGGRGEKEMAVAVEEPGGAWLWWWSGGGKRRSGGLTTGIVVVSGMHTSLLVYLPIYCTNLRIQLIPMLV